MINELKMEVNGFGLVRLSASLVNKLIDFRQLNYKQAESGGVLIGKHLNSSGVMLIDTFTPPQTSDKQGRHSYFRSKEHNKLVQQVWQESDGHSTYVGLWHTHPEPIPNYSSIDKTDWINALNSSKYEGNKLFFVIVGQTHLRCWVGTKGRLRNNIELSGDFKIEK